MKKIGKRAEKFLINEFDGNGKYYLQYYYKRRWCKWYFEIFRDNSPGVVKVIGEGNDASFGGKGGDYVMVEFTMQFYETYAYWIVINLPNRREHVLIYLREIEINKILIE